MDENQVGALQVEAVRRCQDPTPISAEEGRKMLALFSLHLWTRTPQEVNLMVNRVSLDQNERLFAQSVRLQESNERLSKWLIGWTVGLVILTAALTAVGIMPLLKH